MAVVERYEMSTLAVLLCFVNLVHCGQIDIELDAKAALLHKIDSLNILLYTFLLTLTVVTIWLFKHRRLRFLHETGLAVIYGLILGGLIRYLGRESSVTKMTVDQDESDKYNGSFPPDVVFLRFTSQGASSHLVNKTYSYNFRGVNTDVANDIDLKATFDPEVFFNIILPPIIFHAGYSLKRKYFFRNFGSILTYAVLGTTISAFIIGALLYGVILIMSGKSSMTFLDTLFFGALISPTDPVTILAIFSDLKVDATLYSLVFGESVLNDAVAIVLSGSIQNYAEHYQSGSGGFETKAFFLAFGDFVEIFSLSFLIGAAMGCITALLTKFTHLRDFPLLESALFVLMSYSTFLIAESAGLTGVVSVLFCGICQAHYTYNNLSKDSRKRTKQLFELLNFLAENFIFSYIGVSMFTFPKHKFDVGFIIAGFVCACVGRAANIYPLSFIINLGRKPKIPGNFQHMLFYSGLRGAMSFALAIRNTVTEARQMMLTTTSLIVIATVVIQGGATMQLLSFFKIPVGVEEEVEMLPYAGGRGNCRTESPESLPLLSDSDHAVSPELSQAATIRYPDGTFARLRPNYSTAGTPTAQDGEGRGDKAWAAKVWADFDSKYMKPLLTQSRPTLLETLPVCCVPLARLLTTTQQMTQDNYRCESDSDLCIDESISRESSSHRGAPNMLLAELTLKGGGQSQLESLEHHNFM